MQQSVRSTSPLVLLLASAIVNAQVGQNEQTVAPAADPDRVEDATRDPWLDRAQEGIYQSVWRSARRIDRMFGSEEPEELYARAYGSVAPALLWSEFDRFEPQLRFNINAPLPRLNERFNAFLGRVNRDEYVTERAPQSGAFPRQYGPIEDDQTLFGISYREPARQGGRFDAGAGIRVRSPLDPYVKGSYLYQRGTLERALLSLRETVFWQNSEQLGLTSRVDVERIVNDRWLLRWTGSGTVSQESRGLRGYTEFTFLRGFASRRAIAAEIFLDGETDASVPMREYGMKAAYRQSVARNWLILELRTSVTWPKDFPGAPRAPSWGVGLGFEMFFGTEDFLARPVTF